MIVSPDNWAWGQAFRMAAGPGCVQQHGTPVALCFTLLAGRYACFRSKSPAHHRRLNRPLQR